MGMTSAYCKSGTAGLSAVTRTYEISALIKRVASAPKYERITWPYLNNARFPIPSDAFFHVMTILTYFIQKPDQTPIGHFYFRQRPDKLCHQLQKPGNGPFGPGLPQCGS